MTPTIAISKVNGGWVITDHAYQIHICTKIDEVIDLSEKLIIAMDKPKETWPNAVPWVEEALKDGEEN